MCLNVFFYVSLYMYYVHICCLVFARFCFSNTPTACLSTHNKYASLINRNIEYISLWCGMTVILFACSIIYILYIYLNEILAS